MSSQNANNNNIQSSSNVNQLTRMPSQQPQQQQQQPQQLQSSNNNKNSIPSVAPSSAGSSVSSNSMMNNMNNLNNAVNSNSVNPNAPTPQIQHQLIESFRLAVTSGLLSADLLNTRLPSDVLSMLYQLFQVQGQYMNLNSKMDPLSKRRAQMTPQQFKQEHDTLNQDLQVCREHLLTLKTKINNAHMLLKAKMQQQPNFDQHNDPQLMTPLNQLSIKDPQLSTPLGAINMNQPPRSLPKLINDPKSLNSSIGRQPSSGGNNQSISKPHQQQQQQQQQSQLYQPFNNFGQQNWPNFRGDDSNFNNDLSMPLPFDDRITPFIPGQPWTGPGHSSIEDDPNCTPGSVTKSLLHDIDPESRLTNLQHKATWSETSITTTNAITANSRQNSRGSWSSSGGYTTPSLANTTSSIGEQLWGVRGGGGGGGGGNTNPLNRNNNNNSLPFNPSSNAAPGNRNQNFNQNPNNSNSSSSNNSSSNVNMNSHFYRSNSWNISPQQAGGNTGGNNSSYSSNGQYLLLKNIPIQVNLILI